MAARHLGSRCLAGDAGLRGRHGRTYRQRASAASWMRTLRPENLAFVLALAMVLHREHAELDAFPR